MYCFSLTTCLFLALIACVRGDRRLEPQETPGAGEEREWEESPKMPRLLSPVTQRRRCVTGEWVQNWTKRCYATWHVHSRGTTESTSDFFYWITVGQFVSTQLFKIRICLPDWTSTVN